MHAAHLGMVAGLAAAFGLAVDPMLADPMLYERAADVLADAGVDAADRKAAKREVLAWVNGAGVGPSCSEPLHDWLSARLPGVVALHGMMQRHHAACGRDDDTIWNPLTSEMLSLHGFDTELGSDARKKHTWRSWLSLLLLGTESAIMDLVLLGVDAHPTLHLEVPMFDGLVLSRPAGRDAGAEVQRAMVDAARLYGVTLTATLDVLGGTWGEVAA